MNKKSILYKINGFFKSNSSIFFKSVLSIFFFLLTRKLVGMNEINQIENIRRKSESLFVEKSYIKLNSEVRDWEKSNLNVEVKEIIKFQMNWDILQKLPQCFWIENVLVLWISARGTRFKGFYRKKEMLASSERILNRKEPLAIQNCYMYNYKKRYWSLPSWSIRFF